MVEAPIEKIRLLIVDDIAETRENLRKLLYFEPDIEIVGMASDGHEAIEQAKRLLPDIVLMDINMPDMDGITTSQQIGQVAPSCQVIMMSVQSEADYLRRSMLAGAMDFLVKPFTSEELTTSIHRVYEMGASRRVAAPVEPAGDSMGGSGPVAESRQSSTGGKLLVVYSPKGGTGCSTVATNLAIAMVQETSKKVALLDASLQFGDLSVLLNLQGERSVADVADQGEGVDSVMMSAVLAPHPSGVQVIAAPPSPELSETITAEDIKAVVEYLVSDFDYVIVDTWSYLDDTVLAMMDMADRIILAMTPELPSIKSTRLFFQVAEALNLSLDRVDLVLNKVQVRDDIRPERLAASIKHEIKAQLVFDIRDQRLAVNQGLPIMMSDPNHPLSMNFRDLAQQEIMLLEPQPVQEVEEEEVPLTVGSKKRSGLFGRLKR